VKVFALGRRAGWGLADQAFSSLTNFAVGLLIARTVGPADFGAFSLAFALYNVALNMSRALTTQPLVIRHTGPVTPQWRRATTAASGTALLVGIAGGLIVLVVALFTGGAVRDAFLVMGLLMPGLLLQDAWRFAFFSSGRGGHACANDLAWAAIQFPAMVLITFTGRASLLLGMVAWGGAAAVAAVFGLVQAGLVPDPRRALEWWRANRDLSARYVIEVGTGMGGAQVSLYAVTAIAGLAAVGTLRAGELLLGPLNVLFQGIQLAALPEGVRLLRGSTAALRRLSVLLSTVVASAVLLWAAFVWLIPESTGVAVLGATWGPAHSVLIPLAIALAASAANIGATVGLRALAAARRSMNTNLAVTAIAISGNSLGAATRGVQGAATGQAIATIVGAVVWWRQYLRALSQYGEEPRGALTEAEERRPDRDTPLPVPGTPAPRSLD
jgi:O-antigen/teichoic acid export membrane protein